MKTCPVCKATLFDDMEICFGCLHRQDEPAQSEAAQNPVQDSVQKKAPESTGAAYTLRIQLQNGEGTLHTWVVGL